MQRLDPSRRYCHRCKKVLEDYSLVAKVAVSSVRTDIYHVKCLPPNLFHAVEGQSSPVAPGMPGRSRLGGY
jgi:hypothetical protein